MPAAGPHLPSKLRPKIHVRGCEYAILSNCSHNLRETGSYHNLYKLLSTLLDVIYFSVGLAEELIPEES